MDLPSSNEILNALNLLFGPGDKVELRMLGVESGVGTGVVGGVFDDFQALTQAALGTSGYGAKGVYVTLQQLRDDIPVDNTARTIPRGAGVSDVDVVRYRFLPIDIDPRRESGVSATTEEVRAAFECASKIKKFLAGFGFEDPIVASSGNGVHLLYRIDLDSSDVGLVRECLRVLGRRFDNDAVEVDKKMFNPSRICKLYGTLARKGRSTVERPHRKASVIRTGSLRATPRAKLVELAGKEPDINMAAPEGLEDLTVWMQKNFPEARGPIEYITQSGPGVKWVFEQCPFDSKHKDSSFSVIVFPDGNTIAGCSHKSCRSASVSTWYALQHRTSDPFDTLDDMVARAAITVDNTDVGNGRRLANRYPEDMKYIPGLGWYIYDGRRWASGGEEMMARAKSVTSLMEVEAETLEDAKARAELYKWAKQSKDLRKLKAMITCAESEPGMRLRARDLDCNQMLLNVQNGTLNLSTGELHPHRPEDFITKMAPVEYDPEADCPRWTQFMEEIFEGDQALINYIQEAAGYALTGDVSEHCFFFLHGAGRNGKSTLLLLLRELLGDYAVTVDSSILLSTNNQQHPTILMDLAGVRLAITSEVDRGRQFAEARLKQLTSEDGIRARRMRQDFVEFEPSHKLWMAANYKPIIKGRDIGVWSRVRFIPFEASFQGREDTHLLDKLKSEMPGILNWALEGCRRWADQGSLATPVKVERAKEEYKEEMDRLGEFLEDCTVSQENFEVSRDELYERYCSWLDGANERPYGRTLFARALSERGYPLVKKVYSDRVGYVRVFQGIRLNGR